MPAAQAVHAFGRHRLRFAAIPCATGGTINNETYHDGVPIHHTPATLALDSIEDGGKKTTLVIDGAVTLTGGGQVVLSDSTRNLIDFDQTGTLDNVDNLIGGAGKIGQDEGATGGLTNESKGVVNANGVNELLVDTGKTQLVNKGLIEATGAGGLDVAGQAGINNTGSINAAGGNVTIKGPVTGGGQDNISGGASLEFGDQSFDSVTFHHTSVGTNMLILDDPGGFSAELAGGGSVHGFAIGDAIDLEGINVNSKKFSESYNSITGVLTVADNSKTAGITLIGTYASADFGFATDGHGGTLVTTTNNTNVIA